MTLHLHHLTGCAPVPLAFYLKALGVLRIVAEQKDPEARGWWQDEHFCLLTALDRGELETFFLEEYAPTPVFNPWGARSGFYKGSSESTARKALDKITSCGFPRLGSFRETVSAVRKVIEEHGGGKPSDESKSSFIASLRQVVRGAGAEWLSTVMAVVGEETRAPALVGTGGNEGSGSYTSAYLNAVVTCVIDRSADHALGLFSTAGGTGVTPTPNYSWDGSFGQFLPDGVGSAWDLLFAIEGALLFQSTVVSRSQRLQGSAPQFLASPFYFPPHAAGAGSSAPHDEYCMQKGRPRPGRGEQWFPLWTVPAALGELGSVFKEGRCSVGRQHATRSVDAARASSRLGVARGVSEFCRYGYLQRNNVATHFAVPLGRILVSDKPRSRLTDDLSGWLRSLTRQARGSTAPARLVAAERRLADAVYAVLTHDDSPDRWQAVLLAAAAVEAVQASGTAVKAGPLPPLSPEWLLAADDGGPEWRLACALGSAAGGYRRGRKPDDPVRRHWLPLDDWLRRFKVKENRLVQDPWIVAHGRDPIADLGAVVERRVVEAAGRGQRTLPLVAAPGYEAQVSDLAELIGGRVDLDRVLTLARALMAVRWNPSQPGSHTRPKGATTWPDEAWMALRLACLPWPLDGNRRVPAELAMVRRLLSGDGTAAIDIALRRLRAAGLRPPLQVACTDSVSARLWGAALAFPISRRQARGLARRFEATKKEESR